jgi:hypothetical protein
MSGLWEQSPGCRFKVRVSAGAYSLWAICHECIVDATAVDCGEGHTFCRWGGHQRPGYRVPLGAYGALGIPGFAISEGLFTMRHLPRVHYGRHGCRLRGRAPPVGTYGAWPLYVAPNH